MISPTQFKAGIVIKVDNKLFSITSYQHVKPGKGPAYYRTKLKNLKTGVIIEKTLRSDEKIENVFVEEKKLTYLYHDHEIYYFMDQENYEQLPLNKNVCGDILDFLIENTEVTATIAESEIISLNLPNFIELRIKHTEPGAKGDTAKSTSTKTALLENGAEIQVPIFINEGDKIKIDTRIKQYAGKAK